MLRIFFFCLIPLIGFTLSLEEKIGQLLIVHFNGESANEDARLLIQDLHVGGIIYYNWANGLHSPEQVHQLSAGLQKLTAIPLLIAVDQEGGAVMRLQKGFTDFPGNLALKMTGDLALAEKCAFAMGEELAAVGVNFNLAPVVDINSNPRNPLIGIRSFGEDAKEVVNFARSTLSGYRKAHIITCLKHFPGHGDVEIDSHEMLPIVHKSIEELMHVELLPFISLATESETIMTGHLKVPALDEEKCATLSKKTLSFLRKEIGFDGVIVADSLIMEGLLQDCASIEDAAIQALSAGCDLLMLGGKQLIGKRIDFELTIDDMVRIHRALVNAVHQGIISENRIDEALSRVLKLKEGLHFSPQETCEDHSPLAKEVARGALRWQENRPYSYQGNEAIFAPLVVKDAIDNAAFYEDDLEAAIELAKKSDLLLFFSYNMWKSPDQIAFYRALASLQKPLILIALGAPIDSEITPPAHLTILTHSPSSHSIDAAMALFSLIKSRSLNGYEELLITQLRNQQTKTEDFRSATRKITHILAEKILERLPRQTVEIDTCFSHCIGHVLQNPIELVSIMRSGDAMIESLLLHFPEAPISKILIQSDPKTHFLFAKLSPTITSDAYIIIAEPVIVTGKTLDMALTYLKNAGISKKRIIIASISATPQGVLFLREKHPEVQVIFITLDNKIEEGHAIPGLGDFGDRYFQTS
jgi:beta-N-acetylhexosaminidase